MAGAGQLRDRRGRWTGWGRAAEPGPALALAWLLAACTSGTTAPPPPSTPGSVQLAAATWSQAEGAGPVRVVVTRTGGSSGTVTVRLATADGTASAPGDYVALATTVVFADGDTAPRTVEVALVDDAAFEPSETFTVILSSPTGGAALGAPTSATVTILDDDAPVVGAGRLDDTGITTCATATAEGLPCGSAAAGTDLFPRQDAEAGRDLTARDDRDGRAGFSFTKLDAAGAPLADQAASYAASPWPCVLDRVTGLTWEVRPADGGLRDRAWTYSWYQTEGLGGLAGFQNGGSCLGGSGCDTERYAAAVRSLGLCGKADWRLPTRAELLGLVDHGAAAPPLLDGSYFPDALPPRQWSGSPGIAGSWAVDFATGLAAEDHRDRALAVRLVSGGIQQ